MRRWMLVAAFLSLRGLICPAAIALPMTPAKRSAIADPAAYCKTSGTRDTVRRLPRNLRGAAAAALGLPPSAAQSEGYFWRCMDGAVYVCAVGANIPCQSKGDDARRNAGAETFCRGKPDGEIVPAYATGHATIYEWRCESGNAVRGNAVARVDRRGFPVAFWQRLAPEDAG